MVQQQISSIFYELDDNSPTKMKRITYAKSGLFNLCMQVIKDPTENHSTDTLLNAWSLLSVVMCTSSLDEQDNVETLGIGIDLGIVDLAVRELSFNPLRDNGLPMNRAFTVLTNTAAKYEFAGKVVSTGIIPLLVSLIKRKETLLQDEINLDNISMAFSILASFAMLQPNALRDVPDIIKIAVSCLPYLHITDNDLLVITGFKSARILIRLFGKDESSRVIRENPVILEFYPEFIRKLLQSGPENRFEAYDSNWYISGVMLDLSLITVEGNQKLLAPIIPLAIEMLSLYGKSDYELLRYGIIFLSQIVVDDWLRKEILIQEKIRLQMITNIVLSDQLLDKEVISLMVGVVNHYVVLL
jgi:hypothetical protein